VTDLLVGVLIGLGISILFILHSNLRRPLRRIMEKHIRRRAAHRAGKPGEFPEPGHD
jgi:hypothetical protein